LSDHKELFLKDHWQRTPGSAVAGDIDGPGAVAGDIDGPGDSSFSFFLISRFIFVVFLFKANVHLQQWR
jgi:hypothetical protein